MPLNYVHDTKDEIPEQYQDLYSEREGKFYLTAVSGIKTQDDINAMRTGLDAERSAHKETKAKLSTWGEMDHTETMTKLDRFAELELAASGNIEKFDEEVAKTVDARMATKLGPIERESQRLATELGNVILENNAFKEADKLRTIRSQIVQVAKEQKVADSALPDVSVLCDLVFDVTEDGTLITKENAYGVDAGLDPIGFFNFMQTRRETWWPKSNGGGATGGGGGGTVINNPFVKGKDFNLTEQSRMMKENPTQAKRLQQLAAS